MSNYKDKFEPWIEYSYEEKKDICSSNYIEVGRECYHYEGLRNKKNSILVYSAILAGINNEMSDTFSYKNKVLADRLAMDDREVRRAIKDLEEIELVKVTHPTKNKRNIKIIKDLRYPPQKLKKHKSNPKSIRSLCCNSYKPASFLSTKDKKVMGFSMKWLNPITFFFCF